MKSHMVLRRFAALAALLLILCIAGARDESDVVVFLLDSAVDQAFLRGEVLERRGAEVSHGSLVARVLDRYCSARIVSFAVEDRAGAVSRGGYLDALERIAGIVDASPGLRAVVNISLGSTERDAREEQLIRRLCERGVLVVAAAGNDGAEEAEYPASFGGVVAVAAATPQGKAPSSNYGPQISICASGDITFIDYDFVPYERLRREMAARGTSFAAPRVAATVAFVLERRPGLSPSEAFDLVAESAVPIDDELYRRGLLGAGLLNVRRTQSSVAPGYGFLHYTLPWMVCGGLVCLSVYLCLRHGAVGVFLALLLWLVALPVAFFLVVGVSDWLLFLGAGSRSAGLVSALFLAGGLAAAAALQDWQFSKACLAALPILVVLTIALATARLSPAGAVACSAASALLTACLAVAWERRTAGRIRRVRSGRLSLRRMADTYGRAIDGRLRKAIRDEAAARNDPEAVGFFLNRVPERSRAVEGLASVAGRRVDLLLPWLRRIRLLPSGQRRVLLLALERGAPPDAAPVLEDICDEDASGRIARLVGRLRERSARDADA